MIGCRACGAVSDEAQQLLIAWAGGVENLGKNTKMGKVVFANGPPRSAEFRRIAALPRRRWEHAADLDELTTLLTQWLRPPRFDDSMSLRPLQAAALREAHDVKGLFGVIAVNKGKSIIGLCAATVMKAQRPVLVVPVRLKKKAERDVKLYGRHFTVHPNLKIITYYELSQAKNVDLWWRLKPDLIIFDECNKMKVGSARTKRTTAYLEQYPETMVVAMSGTIMKRSLKDFFHVIRWCLKDRLCPLPLDFPTLTDWCNAVDSLRPAEEHKRVGPGVLVEFCEPTETARQGLKRRIVETPGVIHSLDSEEDLGSTLIISEWKAPLPKELHESINRLRDLWETPNGDICPEAVDVWRHARELACGFCYRWDPAAPRPWLDARREWHSFVRNITRRGVWNGARADSLLLVSGQCARMQGDAPREYLAWERIRNTFRPNTVADWISTEVLEHAAAWLNAAKEPPGICWVEHTEVQQKLAALARVPLFGAGNDGIESYRGPCVASMGHGVGKDLQQYSRSLVLSPPPAGDVWEQLLGRTHRGGKNMILNVAQEAEEVTYEVFLPCDDLRDSFRRAIADARVLAELESSQKLLTCDMLVDI